MGKCDSWTNGSLSQSRECTRKHIVKMMLQIDKCFHEVECCNIFLLLFILLQLKRGNFIDWTRFGREVTQTYKENLIKNYLISLQK